MNRVLRQGVLFGGLLLLVFVVDQQVRLQAANFIIYSPLTNDFGRAEWGSVGVGTSVLFKLLAAGALMTVSLGLYRAALGREEGSHGQMEAIVPLTDALTDLKARELAEHREKSAAVARMNQVQQVHTTILDGLSSGALTVDGDGRIATCNPAARTILDWRGPSPIGRSLTELFKGRVPPVMADGPMDGAHGKRVEFSWEPEGGVPKHLGLSVSPIETAAGPLLALLFTDLTELKRLQEQMALRKHLAQLGEVSAGIAHEFRNNMGAVMGYARLLSHETAPDSAAREVLDAMMAELTAMEELIRALLDFGRKSTLQPTSLMTAELLEQAVEVGAAPFDMAVPCMTAPDLPPLWVDEALIRQSVINLVRNGCEAALATDGDPRVTVSARAVAEGRGPAEWVVVSIADNGPGIDPAIRQKIFLPFFTTRDRGTGMGLAQVNKVVTAHGGAITLDDMPGGGAIFRLRLPTIHRKSALTPEAESQ